MNIINHSMRLAVYVCITVGAVVAAAHAAAIGLNITTPQPVSGRDPANHTEILPADVLARVLLLRDELDIIRKEIGKANNTQHVLRVKKAAPREVFFQALTLFNKSDRLAYELTASVAKDPEIPNIESIRPAHVWRMIDAALQRVLFVKSNLGINITITEQQQNDNTTPTQVFISTVQANRQLNLMLERRFSPSDVFEQTTLATNYAARLLSLFPNAVRRPEAPAFARAKMPPDVYQRLLTVFSGIKKISLISNIEMLEVRVPDDEIRIATPSDVYDIASLLVSELSYIHSKCKGLAAPVEVFYPGRKFPSHVYQRAGILAQQVRLLLHKVEKNQDWLEKCG